MNDLFEMNDKIDVSEEGTLKPLSDLQLKLCDIQGRLFELSAEKGYGSAAFARLFMTSDTAKALDSSYNRMQWAGEEYLMEEITESAGAAAITCSASDTSVLRYTAESEKRKSISESEKKSADKAADFFTETNAGYSVKNSLTGGEIYPKEVLYWMGYLYRFWHIYTGESSAKIYRQAPAAAMNRNYLLFHTMDPSLAVEDLKAAGKN